MPLRNLNGDLSLESTQQQILNILTTMRMMNEQIIELLGSSKGGLTDEQLRETPVSIFSPALSVVGSGSAFEAQRVHLSNESLSALENIVVEVGEVEIRNDFNSPIPVDGKIISLSQLVPVEFDEIELGYSNDLVTTVVYKILGETVSTLVLSYNGDVLTGVRRV